ncbi:S8 family serine peptidase [bacterium]|nr:S8 family serine peptidase [bacterium]
MKCLFVLLMAACLSQSAMASEKVIVRLQPNVDLSQFKVMGQRAQLEALVPELGIYAVVTPGRTAKSVLPTLRQQRGVVYAQADHPVTMRQTPNDKSFSQQWDMKLDSTTWGIDALGSWAGFGQGGLDPAGNEIVVAVVDGGVQIDHQDLASNIWVNQNEIPGNNKDDDGNGYIDDVNGWDAISNTGTIDADMHGTHVSGTVGAVGNNAMGIAGINWNVKVMPVNGASGTTSVVLKAYGYVLKQKQLWIKTGGKQGANIVATNSSFGVDYGNCKSAEYAAWNDIYNEMGKAGILHAIATANLGIDVDVKGDVPTGCDSPYIISVTNTQKDGTRNSSAAWGLKMIDLGAPGTGIYSLLDQDGYGSLTGTSMASPHVAGAVAYMHSAASTGFNSLYMQDPSQGALALKEVMLKTVTPAPSLNGKTVSGGILNLNKASQAISAY